MKPERTLQMSDVTKVCDTQREFYTEWFAKGIISAAEHEARLQTIEAIERQLYFFSMPVMEKESA